MKTVTISINIDAEVAAKLDRLEKATEHSKSNLAAEAIEAYVENQFWQIEAIQEGIKEADENHFATDNDVEKTLKKWGVRKIE
jgi:predicted transcriptional regulator